MTENHRIQWLSSSHVSPRTHSPLPLHSRTTSSLSLSPRQPQRRRRRRRRFRRAAIAPTPPTSCHRAAVDSRLQIDAIDAPSRLHIDATGDSRLSTLTLTPIVIESRLHIDVADAPTSTSIPASRWHHQRPSRRSPSIPASRLTPPKPPHNADRSHAPSIPGPSRRHRDCSPTRPLLYHDAAADSLVPSALCCASTLALSTAMRTR